MELSEYNGWENKFTWLIHLHLSNELVLLNEVATLVRQEADNGCAGRLVETWVQVMLMNWLTQTCRDDNSGSTMQLLVWDLVVSALAYADWDGLVFLLTGRLAKSENVFTETLYYHIMVHSDIQQAVVPVVSQATNPYACADALKDWLQTVVDAWMTGSDEQAFLLPLMIALLQDVFKVVVWQHVARAFRPGY